MFVRSLKSEIRNNVRCSQKKVDCFAYLKKQNKGENIQMNAYGRSLQALFLSVTNKDFFFSKIWIGQNETVT